MLAEELSDAGLMLEIAAGSGEHAVYFARLLPQWQWQPSDPDPHARASIAAWRDEEGTPNLLPPMALDASAAGWPIEACDAILCVNMIHISPPEATEGLFDGAGRLLISGAPLILYGPFIEPEIDTAPSNRAFDTSLRQRDARWGLRDTGWLDELATTNGLARTRRVQMPANNLLLVYRKR